MLLFISEISLCLIEDIIVFVFLNSLLKSRYKTVLPSQLAIIAASVANYLCSGFFMTLKIPIAAAVTLLLTVLIYEDKLIIKIVYSVTSMYIIAITDIILGNLISLCLGRSVAYLFFDSIICRFILSMIVKAADVLVFFAFYKMLNKVDKNIKGKFWTLLAVVMIIFLAVTTVFLQIYPYSEQSSVSTTLYTVLAALFFAASLIVIYFFTELSKGFQRDSKLFLLESNFSSLQEQIAVQQQNSENMKKLRHDMKNHLSNIRTLIERGEPENAAALLDQTAESVNIASTEVVDTGNSFADVILLSKAALCREKNIDFTYSVQSLKEIDLDVIDLSSLLSNLLDNAIEAAEQTESPFVRLTIMKYNAYYTICVENSYKGKEYVKEFAGTLISTKPEKALHGYGTQIISDIAQKYGGSYSWEAQEDRFVSTVLVK